MCEPALSANAGSAVSRAVLSGYGAYQKVDVTPRESSYQGVRVPGL
ncbi:MAG: hypothetical protein JWQ98_1804 [Chlorobi bacterium]|nr:hypothetical protein [Chlorobiota bacterium]